MGDWFATRWPLRAGAITAVAAIALLVQRVAIAGNRLAEGWHGALLARLDLATPVLIALVAFVSARRCLAGRTSAGSGFATVRAVYIGWLLTIAFSAAGSIRPVTKLPAISPSTTVDGSTAPGASIAGGPTVRITCDDAPAVADGLVVTAPSSTIRALEIDGCPCSLCSRRLRW